ncbi:hypothetical protein HMPREF1584_00184 [Gardnerella vaginalis JCP8481A]|uniref:Uncharacterized protein n=1 Tax=Gardnerella vaginalis TaxID=2702 RepID=A0A133P2X0_GARVA|nr:hypothetical protein HMPREF1585_01253 [Gardnerella vaginalis JCP8481B]EPI44755.1 hypothetical protein HMPREF1584_00184 [Gardnerella vaginalis JCP8481A]KXA22850.1 hypothetical protein HMPREF3208_00076 [Gardnerella vaginalis]
MALVADADYWLVRNETVMLTSSYESKDTKIGKHIAWYFYIDFIE